MRAELVLPLACWGVLMLVVPCRAEDLSPARSQSATLMEPRPIPNGRVLPFDLQEIDEKSLLPNPARSSLYALGRNPRDFHNYRIPVVRVRGLHGSPHELQPVI